MDILFWTDLYTFPIYISVDGARCMTIFLGQNNKCVLSYLLFRYPQHFVVTLSDWYWPPSGEKKKFLKKWKSFMPSFVQCHPSNSEMISGCRWSSAYSHSNWIQTWLFHFGQHFRLVFEQQNSSRTPKNLALPVLN